MKIGMNNLPAYLGSHVQSYVLSRFSLEAMIRFVTVSACRVYLRLVGWILNEYLNIPTYCQYSNEFVNNLDRFRMESLLVLWKYFLVFTPRGGGSENWNE